jgi:hypothetical protein
MSASILPEATPRGGGLAAQILGDQRTEIDRRGEQREAEAVEHDRQIVADVRGSREAAGKQWTAEIEAEMLARLAERRQSAD